MRSLGRSRRPARRGRSPSRPDALALARLDYGPRRAAVVAVLARVRRASGVGEAGPDPGLEPPSRRWWHSPAQSDGAARSADAARGPCRAASRVPAPLRRGGALVARGGDRGLPQRPLVPHAGALGAELGRVADPGLPRFRLPGVPAATGRRDRSDHPEPAGRAGFAGPLALGSFHGSVPRRPWRPLAGRVARPGVGRARPGEGIGGARASAGRRGGHRRAGLPQVAAGAPVPDALLPRPRLPRPDAALGLPALDGRPALRVAGADAAEVGADRLGTPGGRRAVLGNRPLGRGGRPRLFLRLPW